MKRERLTNERLNRKWSRKHVANILGISEIFVRKIENGQRNPGLETMLKFEKLYGVSSKKLFPDLFQINFDTKRIKKRLA
ncbi:multiprotein-bridging factor 1 family protein (plasmid) [Aneurinibacillus thermoaerophilus]|uniref:Helix-turn-helix transcriptional regulator n=1 Tax=Aneurinibacillus thermoaerophilus TaxID=143495 RepID=A0ABX8YH78_ANETH|nr:helix-turn-helix transcriptional regulator [Aneurinibacillus thermoaerophilus]QYY44725.1 helix-turn-helix transcriptional regulator [Aneurinibacillus thermoaerophilus]